MISSTQTKIVCSKCVKAASVLACRGCGKDFCYRHLAEHRTELNQQMTDLTNDHDLFQRSIVDSSHHPLFEQINVWEENTIEKIHQIAQQIREQTLQIVDKHQAKIAQQLSLLTQQLNQAQTDDDFVETNLQQWTEQLNQLKTDLVSLKIIDFGEDNQESISIPAISVQDNSNSLFPFQPWFGDIQLLDQGRTVLHGPTNQIATIITRQAFSTGQHTFRLRIDRLYTSQYFVFGIAFADLNINTTSPIYLNKYGKSLIQYGSYSEYNQLNLFSLTNSNNIVHSNDVLKFQLDCSNQRLRMTNERTNYQQDFSTNQIRCKLPWKMVFGLFHSDDCIRFCFFDK